MDAATTALIASLQTRLGLLEDKDALYTLLNTYAAACDAGDAALFKTTFAENGILGSSWFEPVQGRDIIAAQIGSGSAFGHLMHSISNIQVTVDGSDRAHGRAYLSFYAVPDGGKLGQNYVFGGPYTFEFVREGKEEDEAGRGWRIQKLEIDRWWEQGHDTTGAFKQGGTEGEK